MGKGIRYKMGECRSQWRTTDDTKCTKEKHRQRSGKVGNKNEK